MRKGREEILRKQIHTEKQNARRSMSTGILNGRAENGTRTRDPQLGKFIVETMKITIQQQYTISMFQKFVNYTSTTVKNYCVYDVNLTKIRKIYIYQDIKSYCTPNPMYGFIPCGVKLCSTGNLVPGMDPPEIFARQRAVSVNDPRSTAPCHR